MTPEPDPTRDPEDADLIAYLDGELDDPQTRAVEARIAREPEARAKAEAYKKTFDLLDFLPRTEPSPDFTNRTLTKLQPAVAGQSAATTALSGPVRGPVSAPSGWRHGLAWAVVGLLALGGGYLSHAALRHAIPSPEADALALSDLPVIEHLPLYLGVDDLEFVRKLDAPELFAPEPASPSSPMPAAHPDPSAESREKLIAQFKGYPPQRQQQLRSLDKQLAELPTTERDRLFGVLDGYAAWLDRLPDADRKDVLAAPNPDDRLEAVRRVRERAWRDTLPARYREQLKHVADPEERVRLVGRWKEAEANRRDEWVLAHRQWEEFARGPGAKVWPFSDPSLANQVNEYVRTVLRADPAMRLEPKAELPASCRLTRDEFLELKARHEAAVGEGYWLMYGACVRRLAERHPGLPEPVGKPPITDFATTPNDVVKELKKAKANADVRKAHVQGKWPEYALEIALVAQKAGATLPEPLGPCRPGEFAPAVNGFLTNTLSAALTPAEREGLKKLEGKWPEYPRQMIDLARKHDLSVPGVTLPGPPSLWAKYYSIGSK